LVSRLSWALLAGMVMVAFFFGDLCSFLGLVGITLNSDDWAEQKYLESLGRREVFDYGKELTIERVLLTSTWAIAISLLLGRVGWQVRKERSRSPTKKEKGKRVGLSGYHVVLESFSKEARKRKSDNDDDAYAFFVPPLAHTNCIVVFSFLVCFMETKHPE